jgi:hypothetical protein
LALRRFAFPVHDFFFLVHELPRWLQIVPIYPGSQLIHVFLSAIPCNAHGCRRTCSFQSVHRLAWVPDTARGHPPAQRVRCALGVGRRRLLVYILPCSNSSIIIRYKTIQHRVLSFVSAYPDLVSTKTRPTNPPTRPSVAGATTKGLLSVRVLHKTRYPGSAPRRTATAGAGA